MPRRQLTTGDLLLAHLQGQRRQWRHTEPLAGEGDDEGIHDLRAAVSRVRGAFGTYRAALADGAVDGLRTEMRWLAGTLGAARDPQVLHARLDPAADLGDAQATPPFELSRELARAEADELAALLGTLHSGRYAALVKTFDELLGDPPLAPAAARPAREAVPRLLARDARRLRARVKKAERTGAGAEHDAALHEARRAAKRLRFAAESATPLFPHRAPRFAAAAKEIQDILGEHHDAVVAATTIEALIAPGPPDATAVDLTELARQQRALADRAERRFWKTWKHFPRVRPRHWP